MLSTKANQRIYEWRSTFASAAVAAINNFFLTSASITTSAAITMNKHCAEFAKEKLKNFVFLFACGQDKVVSLIQVQLYTTDDPDRVYIQLSSFFHLQFHQSSNIIEEAT